MAFDLQSLLQMILSPGVADVLGGAAKAGQAQNNTADTLALSQGNLALNRDKFATEAPKERLATSVRASLGSNYTPRKTTWAGPGSGLRGEIPQITGGLSAGLTNLDPRTKQLQDQVLNDSLLAQMKGGESGGGRDRYTAPVNQSSLSDKLLGGAALATGLANGATGGKSGGGSGGELPIQQLIDMFKRKPGETAPGTGVWQDPNNPYGGDLGPGKGPLLINGPTNNGIGQGELESTYGLPDGTTLPGGQSSFQPPDTGLGSHDLTQDNGRVNIPGMEGFTPQDILSYFTEQPQEDPRVVQNGYDEDLGFRL